MATYPLLPVLDPQGTTEAPGAYGLRAFRFLVDTRIVAGVLDTDTLELALHASHGIVTAREMFLGARETLHAVRSDILATVTRRQREARAAAAAVVPPVPAKPINGHKVAVKRPVPILPPSGATANPF